MRREQPGGFAVVRSGGVQCDEPGLADVHSERRTPSRPRQATGNRLCAATGEAHPVDQSAVTWKSNDPSAGVPGLRACGDAPNLHEAEAESAKPLKPSPILVHPGCRAEGSWEVCPEGADAQLIIPRTERPPKKGSQRRKRSGAP